MPVRHSLLGPLPPPPPPVETLLTEMPPVGDVATAGSALLPSQHQLLTKRDTAVTLQERRPSSTAGRLLRSLPPSRASLAPSVTAALCRPALRHAVTLSSLEQARHRCGCSRCGSARALLLPADRRATCRVCLADVSAADLLRLEACGCRCCKECMAAYVSVCVGNGEPAVPCPEPHCPADGRLSDHEVRQLADAATYARYQRLAYIREVERDPQRTWCPRPGCDTACPLPTSDGPFRCDTCRQTFCAVCRRPRDADAAAAHECRPERWLLGGSQLLAGAVKQCPHCGVPIEREDGCAQMMCRRCRHVFCWYCLSSLDGDLFLRHYDRGPCRHLLGHSRGSLVWHRVQLVGALIGVGLVFVVAAPVLIVFAPVFMCTGCQCDPAQASAGGDSAAAEAAGSGPVSPAAPAQSI